MKQMEKEFRLRVSECGANNLWRPGAILTEMQEIAGAHCDAVGCGREKLREEGIAWVVTRMSLHMERYPRMGETVRLKTFHRPVRHRFFPRYFEFLDQDGQRLGEASSLWLLMDLETRQSVAADRLPVPLPDNRDMPEIMPLPGNIRQLDAPETVIPRRAQYTDLDSNGHVNNTKYADWLCDALGMETMGIGRIDDLLIHYNSEILPDQEVELRLRREGPLFQLSGMRGDQIAFELGGRMREITPVCPIDGAGN